MADGEYGRFRHRGMRGQRTLHFFRVHFLAPAIDHLFQAAGEEQEAIAIEAAHIARMEPALAKRRLVRFRVVKVPGSDRRPTHRDFAIHSRGHGISERVHDGHLQAGAPAHRPEPACVRHVAGHAAGFRKAVAGQHWSANGFLQRGQHCGIGNAPVVRIIRSGTSRKISGCSRANASMARCNGAVDVSHVGRNSRTHCGRAPGR